MRPLYDSSRIFDLIVTVVGVFVIVGLLSYVVHKTRAKQSAGCSGSDTSLVVDNAACPPHDKRGCQSGALFTTSDGSTQLCDYVNHAVGTSCESACHVDGTSTTCTADGYCASPDPTTCLGYCETEEPSDEASSSEDCNGAFTFLDYFKYGGSESSCNRLNWLYYSDFEPECHKIEGCRAYATVMQFLSTASVWLTTQPGSYPGCLDFLNMTNSGCVRAYRLNFTEEFANKFFRSILEQLGGETWTGDYYSGYGCIYTYTCGVRNETFMTDPGNLLGDVENRKRALTSTEDEEARFASLLSRNAPAMRRRWQGLVHRMKRVECSF